MDNHIEIDNLEFGYHSNETIISIEAFSLKKAEKVFLYGPSGYGKTTLLNLIAGVLPPRSGGLQILNRDYSTVNELEKDRYRGKDIGYIFQQFNLVSYMNTLENITLPARVHGVSRFESQIRAQKLSKHLQIDHLVSKRVTHLSIGQQQRVAVARALLLKPKLIIADEPTSSLDDKNTDIFMKLLIQECDQESTSLLFVSHDLSLQKYFDRTVNLEEINRINVGGRDV